MRFLVDECTTHKVACWLNEQDHDDVLVLKKAKDENRIICL